MSEALPTLPPRSSPSPMDDPWPASQAEADLPAPERETVPPWPERGALRALDALLRRELPLPEDEEELQPQSEARPQPARVAMPGAVLPAPPPATPPSLWADSAELEGETAPSRAPRDPSATPVPLPMPSISMVTALVPAPAPAPVEAEAELEDDPTEETSATFGERERVGGTAQPPTGPSRSPTPADDETSRELALLREQVAEGLSLIHQGVETLQRISAQLERSGAQIELGTKQQGQLVKLATGIQAEQLAQVLTPRRQGLFREASEPCRVALERYIGPAAAGFVIAVLGGAVYSAIENLPGFAWALLAGP